MIRTLDDARQNPLFRVATDFSLPLKGRIKLANDWIPAANNYYDDRPPGVRDQMPNPSMPYFGATPSSTWIRTTGNPNNVPVAPNFEGPVGNLISTPWGQRLGAWWFTYLNNTPNDLHYIFQDWGQFSVPSPGCSALKDFRLTSTRPFL